jgi:hypothetical protein
MRIFDEKIMKIRRSGIIKKTFLNKKRIKNKSKNNINKIFNEEGD